MKYFFVVALTVAFLAAAIMPAYALDKRIENNKKIAEYISDTLKLPMMLVGNFLKWDHEQVKEDLNYKGHKALGEIIRKSE